MKKPTADARSDELRPEYDLDELTGGVRGKYVRRLRPGASLVVLDPDVAETFPDAASVNRALRLLVDVAAATKVRRSRRKRRSPARRR